MADLVTETSRVFQEAVNLANSWGDAALPSGRSVRQALTVRGISWWDIVETELAMYKIPPALHRDARPPSAFEIVRPFLGRAKHHIRHLIRAARNIHACVSWPREPVILFLGFEENMYRSVLAPVNAYLSKENGITTIVLHDGYRERGAGSQSLFQHVDAGVNAYAAGLRRDLAIAVKELYAPRALPAIIRAHDKSLWPLMRGAFAWFFYQRIPQLALQAAAAAHILEQHRPALVISPDAADPRTRIYYLLCREFSIPSLEIQFGLTGPDSVEYRFFLADRIAAFGRESRDLMRAYGVPEARIAVTGSPRYDEFIPVAPSEQEKIRRRFGLPAGKKVILYAATWYMRGYPKVKAVAALMTEAFFTAADKLQGACLLVKPHPVFPRQAKELRARAGARRNIFFADPRDNIQELIRACDAFVALGSTSTLDALIAGKLTITPVFPEWSANHQFAGTGATLVPRSYEDVARIFNRIAAGHCGDIAAQLQPGRRQFLENWFYKTDGRASQRICSLAIEMAHMPTLQ